jgi:hypothetical protein
MFARSCFGSSLRFSITCSCSRLSSHLIRCIHLHCHNLQAIADDEINQNLDEGTVLYCLFAEWLTYDRKLVRCFQRIGERSKFFPMFAISMTGPPSFSSFPVIALKPSSISFSTRPQLVDEEDKRGEYSQSRTISSRQQGSERKEAKRRRDRERAAALVKGEKRNIGHEGGVDKGNLASKRLDRRIEVDDDVPWYEASGEGKVLLGYEEDFESVRGSGPSITIVGLQSMLDCSQGILLRHRGR